MNGTTLHGLWLFIVASLILSSCSYEDIYPVSKRTVPADYRSFVKEGKRWDYENNGTSYSYIIQGDTIIGKKAYKKFLKQDPKQTGDKKWHYAGALREAAMQVLYVKAGTKEEERLYDFGVHMGDKMKWFGDRLTVSRTDHIVVSKGFRHRTIMIYGTSGGGLRHDVMPYCMEWMEGIGDKWDCLYWLEFGRKLSACYEDGVCIYDAEYVGYDDGSVKTETFDANVFDSSAEETAFHDWVETHPDSAGYMNIWFEGSSLCVKGIMKLRPYPAIVECFTENFDDEDPKKVNETHFSIYQQYGGSENELAPSWVNLRIEGFQPGKYHFMPNNRGPYIVPMDEQTLTCNN